MGTGTHRKGSGEEKIRGRSIVLAMWRMMPYISFMKTIDTAPKSANAYPQQNAGLLRDRPPHALNDRGVTLRAGARAESMFAGGAAVLGGTALRGIVWAVVEGQAVVDFGCTAGGHGLRVVADVADLVAS